MQIFVDRIAKMEPDLADRLRGWPRTLRLGDLFSGAGTFYKVSNAIMAALNKRFPDELEDVKVFVSALMGGGHDHDHVCSV